MTNISQKSKTTKKIQTDENLDTGIWIHYGRIVTKPNRLTYQCYTVD